MGTVYKALHTRLKRPVAIKLLPGRRLADPEAVARFQREMEAVGRLDHPHLVRAYDAGEAEGHQFLVMEFLHGVDLAKLVRRDGPLPVADACEVVRQAAMGLQHAHEHGLVHRDVKPSNLMLTSTGQVKVLDLGLARLTVETPDAEMTSSGQVVGTGDFIAPEQGRDTRQADARSDVYSLGCTLYFLLTGKAPFAGPQYDTFMKKVIAHSQEPIPPIQQFCPDLPGPMLAVLGRMLAKEPGKRFQTAAEVAEALVPFSHGSDLTRIVQGRGEPRRIAEGVQAPRRWRRNRWFTAVFILVVAALGSWYAGARLLAPRNEGPRSTSPTAVPSHPPQGDDGGAAEVQADLKEVRKEMRASVKEMANEMQDELKEMDKDRRRESEEELQKVKARAAKARGSQPSQPNGS